MAWPLLVLLALAALGAAVDLGSSSLGLAELWRGATPDTDPTARAILLDLRLPRALAAFGAGAVLAIAGVLMQALLRNPLADPYILGVSGGAAVAALGAMVLGLAGVWIPVGAAAGALTAMLAVFALAHGAGGWTPTRLLLVGVVVASGCSAMVSLLLALSDEARLKGMLFWLMGDLAHAGSPWPILALAAIATPLAIAVGRPLNVLARGDLQAQVTGLAVRPLRIGVYIGASLLTAGAVTTAGSVGFVGLVTPHLARLWLGSDHRVVAPAAALLGGTLVVVADLLARTIVAPRQLPVGALTALVGVPLFLALMRRQRSVA